MTEIWNDLELQRPPLVTLPVTNARKAGLLGVMLNRSLKRLNEWNEEFGYLAALLGRLMAHRYNSFRRMVGFRTLRKLYSALCRLLQLDLPRDLETLSGALPACVFVEDDSSADVPSVNTIDFVLVRLIAVRHLYEHISRLCKEAGKFFAGMIQANLFLPISTLFLAVLAKLDDQVPKYANEYGRLYRELLGNRMHFPKQKHFHLLPDDFVLPDEMAPYGVAKPNTTASASAPGTAETVESPAISQPTSNVTKPIITMLAKTPTTTQHRNIDVGVELKRDDVATVAVKRPTVNFNAEQFSTVQDVRKFIAEENKSRVKSLKSSVTMKIANHEWVGAQKLFERKVAQKEHKKAISVFLKFISSKI